MSAAKSPRALRVLTVNLQHCAPNSSHRRGLSVESIADPGEARRVIEELAKQIRACDADVVALQEVDYRQKRSGTIDQVGALREALGWPSGQFCAAYAGAVNGLRRRPAQMALQSSADDYLGPFLALTGKPLRGYGIGLLSKYPVTSWHMARLGRGPATIVRRKGAFLGHKVFTSSMRVLLAAHIDTPVGPVVVGSAHLATRGDEARRQLVDSWAALQDVAPSTESLPPAHETRKSTSTAHVLVGDFNINAEDLQKTGIGRPVGEGATFPSEDPRQRIDHIVLDPLPLSPEGIMAGSCEKNSSDSSRNDAVSSSHSVAAPLVAKQWGVEHFCVSDHRGTWADLVRCDQLSTFLQN
ncbi:endonuclease/exonuclease/phosphatase family protein [Actinomyces vulturis]|uniref:endonuclease/exonuclease/phosphatase family protein n=1 Tax=Actinomyces vulturis TaxID=1857645 RepID=UPI0008322664|nr:endonuclease/exonuclease/phosphatase family protein [Actinomyces vulturis]